MAFLLTEQFHNTEADYWRSFISLCLKRKFNYITVEQSLTCECIRQSDAFYAFRFKDGSVLTLFWNDADEKWDTWMTYVEPWAVTALKAQAAEQEKEADR